MKKTIYILSLLLFTQISFGQTIKVSLSGDWEDGLMIKLNGFYGLEMYSLDSSTTKLLNVIIPDSLEQAEFVLGVFRGKSLLYKKSMLYNKSDLDLDINVTQKQLYPKWNKPGLNLLWEEYKQRYDSIEKRIQVILGLYSYGADTSSLFYHKLYQELDRSKNDLKVNFQQYSDAHKNDVLGNYLTNSYFDLPDFDLSDKDRMLQMRNHFFNYYHPLDYLVVHSSLYKAKLEDVLKLSESIAMYDSDVINQDVIMDGLDEYLILLVENESIQAQTLSALWDKYHYKSLDLVTKYLDENWIATQCHAEDDVMLQERLESYERLAKGKDAPDFEFQAIINSEEVNHRLSDFEGKRIVLAFWASWCPHCEEMLPEVKEYTDTHSDIQVVTVGLDEVRSAWINAIQRYPGWIHIQGKEKWDSPWARAYSIYATPTFYVIDKETKMLGKANNVNELIRLLIE